MAETLTIGEDTPYSPKRGVPAELYQSNPCQKHRHSKNDISPEAFLRLVLVNKLYLADCLDFTSDQMRLLSTLEPADQASSIFQVLKENGFASRIKRRETLANKIALENTRYLLLLSA